jgi:hypothetical protein
VFCVLVAVSVGCVMYPVTVDVAYPVPGGARDGGAVRVTYRFGIVDKVRKRTAGRRP